MADVKISALPAATTPLAGTEVLPIVQGTSTVKVANNDLRPKQIQSNTTSGVLQVTGPAAASTRVMTTPDANFTAARTDAAQSFTGDQTLTTGNLVIGTSGKGIDFSANNSAPGMTSELLDWYEEGVWTPTFTCATPGDLSVTYAVQTGRYTRIGRIVTVNFYVQLSAYSQTTASGAVFINGLPFTIKAEDFSRGNFSWYNTIDKTGFVSFVLIPTDARTGFQIYAGKMGAASDTVNIADLTAGTHAYAGSMTYEV